VKVTGRPDQVANVRSVTVDMNMSGLRDASVTLPGDLVARTESGNPVAITLSQTSARVTFHLEQTFSQRTVPIIPVITGSPAPGYYVSAITVTPPVAVVTGLKAFVDGLKQMSTEKLDITNATRTLTMTRQLDRPPNVSVDRQSVTVTVELRPVDCASGGASTPCGGATLIVAPVFDPVPAGFAVDSAPSSVQVHVSGSILQLATLKPADVRVTVPMTTARLGSSVDPITITFRALP
jgi:YbbR domain-containing protein